jgi:hypothetical protein
MATDHTTSSTATLEQEAVPAEHDVQPEAGGAGAHGGVHLPPTSLWPITLAFAITIAASGLVTNLLVTIPALVLFVLALRGWALELLHAEH